MRMLKSEVLGGHGGVGVFLSVGGGVHAYL